MLVLKIEYQKNSTQPLKSRKKGSLNLYGLFDIN